MCMYQYRISLFNNNMNTPKLSLFYCLTLNKLISIVFFHYGTYPKTGKQNKLKIIFPFNTPIHFFVSLHPLFTFFPFFFFLFLFFLFLFSLFFFSPLFPSFFHEVLLQILPCFSFWTKNFGGGEMARIYIPEEKRKRKKKK